MKKFSLNGLAGVVSISIWLWSTGHADEMVIRHIGKVDAFSTNGNVQLELFYVASSTNKMAFDQYWIAKPNSHQALAIADTNRIIDFGDKICGFDMSPIEMLLYPGITNIGNPLSEKDIRQYFTPIFERFHQHEKSGIVWKPLQPDSLFPRGVLDSAPRIYGFGFRVLKTTVTQTNVTVALRGERSELGQADRTNNIALLTFDKNWNLSEARLITNSQTLEQK